MIILFMKFNIMLLAICYLLLCSPAATLFFLDAILFVVFRGLRNRLPGEIMMNYQLKCLQQFCSAKKMHKPW